jgi:cell shape-determining protein MreD
MRQIVYIIITGALVALTFGLFNALGWHDFVPNLLLVLVVSLALAFNRFDYLIVAFFGGFWFDVLYGLPVGSFSIPLVLIGLGSSQIFQRWLFTEVTWRHFLLAVALATIALHFWLWIYTNLLFTIHWSPLAINGGQLLHSTVTILIANVVLAYPIYVSVELIAQSTSRFKRNRIRI